MSGVPRLDDVAGEWVPAAELGHLPSLRNQHGQAHVNHDLTSLSWLASPPYAGGYHTGVLRLDGVALVAQQFLWKPWGVRRAYAGDRVRVETDTRMAYEAERLLWRVAVSNDSDRPRRFEITQDLYAPFARSETGWGWLHNVPWNASDEHDYHALERIRETTRAEGPYVLGAGSRRLRLGRPRLPGIQRDEDQEPMLLEYELPRHVSADTVYPYRSSVRGMVRGVRWSAPPSGSAGQAAWDGPVSLLDDTEMVLDAFELFAGLRIDVSFRLDDAGHDGVLLTHGNTPDSLQIGVSAGRPWVGICGERADSSVPLAEGRFHDLSVEVGADDVALLVDGVEVVRTGHWTKPVRWKSAIAGRVGEPVVNVEDTRSGARSVYAFAVPPDRLETQGAGARATWVLELAPGETAVIGFVCAFGDTPDATVPDLDQEMTDTETGWHTLWTAAFTPGNPHFSGHLPILDTPDADLARAYYMGALLVLYLRSTVAGRTAPMFLTGGPRLGATTTYYWDHTEWGRMYALLDPSGLREWLLRALSGPYDEALGFDLWGGGPLGNYYVANDAALFQLVEYYVGATGDVEFLSVTAGRRTVLEHVEWLAYGFADRRTEATGGVLADFGPDAWTVLECVPTYVNAMASFNAAYVKMLRSYAALLRFLGHDPGNAEAEADAIAVGVLDLYAGGGRWQIRHPDARETIGHVLDFGLVAASMAADLPDHVRDEMVTFVTDHLLADPWMRALAADDPIAPFSDRPDHGAGGAFGAWPGVTAYGLAKLGRPDLAATVLGRTPRAASGGLWGQAMEIGPEGRVRVAGRGVANRDSIAGAATSEAVIAGLFGVEPGYSTLRSPQPRPTTVAIPGLGSLSNLNLHPAPQRVGTG